MVNDLAKRKYKKQAGAELCQAQGKLQLIPLFIVSLFFKTSVEGLEG